MPISPASGHQIYVRLTQPEAQQLTDASARLRLSRNDLVRLALDDLYRGARLNKVRRFEPAVAA
jgi:hypothetical protein